MQRIYLDYNASTPIDARVIDAMRPYLVEAYGNGVGAGMDVVAV